MALDDATSKKWIRCKADEMAYDAGCRVDESRGQLVLDFWETNLKLYEGAFAGLPFKAQPWQHDFVMRLFGWVEYSEKWQRWVRRFRTCNLWIPKKNGKSPTLAAIGLYLLFADGEQGGKTYFFAKDGQQARDIAGTHALKMFYSSDVLSDPDRASVNKNLMQITDWTTNSILRPASSGNARSKDSKEGLNGNILIDETHVVDRDAVDILAGAGISREEPLRVEVSTAGSNPAGYGKWRFDYGEKVNAGLVEDLQHLHIAYAVPQNLTDAELAKDPEHYGKLANPGWGHTIDPKEFTRSYKRACVSPHELSKFKMYRLNVWANADNPWLNPLHWSNCATKDRAKYLDSLRGSMCWAGLDLSKTRDTTALVLCFEPESAGKPYRLLPFFFLPEESAGQMRDKVPYQDWQASGSITLTDGNVTDYEAIKQFIVSLREEYDIQQLFFDPWNASHLCQQLDTEGLSCIEFGQGVSRMNEPTKEFERLVTSRMIEHDDNPCMNWQIGNATVKSDANGNVKVVKPKPDDYRKVDGCVAAIMALQGAMSGMGGATTYYDENELEIG